MTVAGIARFDDFNGAALFPRESLNRAILCISSFSGRKKKAEQNGSSGAGK
jgi:hypothetical protein